MDKDLFKITPEIDTKGLKRLWHDETDPYKKYEIKQKLIRGAKINISNDQVFIKRNLIIQKK